MTPRVSQKLTLAFLALTLPCWAQINQDFELNASAESINASATGVLLTGQPIVNGPNDQYILPVAGSVDYNAYTYAGNSLGVPPNPTGGAQFVAGISQGTVFARAQRNNVPYLPGTGLWSMSVDFCAAFSGVLPAAQNLGSLSLQPYPGPQSFILLFTWNNVATATGFDINIIGSDAANLTLPNFLIPDPAFQNLPINTWYRISVIIDLSSNQLVAARVGPVGTLCPTTFGFALGQIYLGGGNTPTGLVSGYRFFGGGSLGNTACFDNLSIQPASNLTPDWQVNGPSALDINGTLGTAFTKARTVACVSSSVSINFNGPVGAPWEIAAHFSPTLSACNGGITLSDGQVVNVNLADPTFFWIFGGVAPAPILFPGSAAIVLGTPAASLTLSAQQVHVVPAAPLGVVLSQAVQLDVSGSASLPGPIADDSVVTFTIGQNPFCTAATSIPFFATAYTQFNVSSNGRVLFGGIDTTFTATAAAALLSPPFFGAWCDLNPALGGAITAGETSPGIIDVTYVGVPYFASAIPNTFTLSMNSVTGACSIQLLPGIAANTTQQFLGISLGTLGATDPGPTTFSLGGPNPGPLGIGMIYSAGPAGTNAPATMTNLVFTPNAFGSYDWSGT